jgi:hypothetical protein
MCNTLICSQHYGKVIFYGSSLGMSLLEAFMFPLLKIGRILGYEPKGSLFVYYAEKQTHEAIGEIVFGDKCLLVTLTLPQEKDHALVTKLEA